MTTQAVIDRVKFRLGAIKGLNARIELDEQDLSELVDMALDELVEKIDTPSMLILPYQEIIDLKQYRIAAIDLVTRSEVPYGVTQGVNLDPFYLSNSTLVHSNTGNGGLNSVLQMQAAYTIRTMAQNTVQAELVHFHDIYKKTLTVSYSGTRPNAITILYRPDIQCVEDLPSRTWTTYLIRLATAHGKIIIGRIRAKFASSPSPIGINSEILSEGLAELAAIYEELLPLTGSSVI